MTARDRAAPLRRSTCRSSRSSSAPSSIYFSQRAYPGAVRYIVAALPMVYAFAAQEMFRLRMWIVPAAIVTFALLVPRVGQLRDVASGHGEDDAGLGGDFDPRPLVRAIQAQRYTAEHLRQLRP